MYSISTGVYVRAHFSGYAVHLACATYRISKHLSTPRRQKKTDECNRAHHQDSGDQTKDTQARNMINYFLPSSIPVRRMPSGLLAPPVTPNYFIMTVGGRSACPSAPQQAVEPCIEISRNLSTHGTTPYTTCPCGLRVFPTVPSPQFTESWRTPL